eukprot:TRINITY_DN5837_c0_g1_i1.p1 TRINITY_DN5837_c0_g1~~TRINITY_DN5837_c0_g1_i1.p1  ORF type:complete len:281 (-),score=37.23 TRINITY_DN5837_c0_g1_i1:12-854(-)
MEASSFQKIYPLEFYRKFLVQSVRPDGRGLLKTRKTTISAGSISTADASAFVRIGNTSVVAGITAEIGAPPLNEQLQTIINVELTPLCSTQFISGKPSTQAMALSAQLNSLVQSTQLIQQKDLNFDTDGRLVWYLYVDIYCLDYDGNMYDACVLALQAALRDLQLFHGEIGPKGEGIANNDVPPRKLLLRHVLVPLSFAVVDDYLLADPSQEEESLSSGVLSIVYSSKGFLCEVYKPGGVIFDDSKIKECMARAKGRVKEVVRMLDKVSQPISSEANRTS